MRMGVVGFDRDVWEGRKAILAPIPPSTVEPGDHVAARTPIDLDGNPVNFGIVLAVDVNDEGEKLVTFASEYRPPRTKTVPRVAWRYSVRSALVSDLDPARHVPAGAIGGSGRAADAARILLAVAADHENGRHWSPTALYLVGAAQRLAATSCS
jgi:hypothetical protein